MHRAVCQNVLFSSLFAAALLVCAPAGAQTIKPSGTFGTWNVFHSTDKGAKICFMAAKPEKSEGKYTKRGDVYAQVTHRPGEKTKNTFSYMTGYSFKPKSEVTVTVDGRSFTLFTHGETAWAPDQGTDDALAAAIQKGSKMVVKGTSSRGNLTTDSFSLKGSGDAYAAISKECGV